MAFNHEPGTSMKCLSIPIKLVKDQMIDAEGREIRRCGFKIGGGIDQDFTRSPQGYMDNGIYVTEVHEGSPASESGLKVHDKILQCNGYDFTMVTHKKAVSYIQKHPVLSLLIARKGVTHSKIQLLCLSSMVRAREGYAPVEMEVHSCCSSKAACVIVAVLDMLSSCSILAAVLWLVTVSEPQIIGAILNLNLWGVAMWLVFRSIVSFFTSTLMIIAVARGNEFLMLPWLVSAAASFFGGAVVAIAAPLGLVLLRVSGQDDSYAGPDPKLLVGSCILISIGVAIALCLYFIPLSHYLILLKRSKKMKQLPQNQDSMQSMLPLLRLTHDPGPDPKLLVGSCILISIGVAIALCLYFIPLSHYLFLKLLEVLLERIFRLVNSAETIEENETTAAKPGFNAVDVTPPASYPRSYLNLKRLVCSHHPYLIFKDQKLGKDDSNYALQIALKHMKDRCQKQQARIQVLEEENKRLIQNKSELYSEIGKLQEHNIRLRERNLALNHEVHSKHQESCDMRENISSLSRDHASCASQLNGLQSDCETLKTKVSRLTEENKELKRRSFELAIGALTSVGVQTDSLTESPSCEIKVERVARAQSPLGRLTSWIGGRKSVAKDSGTGLEVPADPPSLKEREDKNGFLVVDVLDQKVPTSDDDSLLHDTLSKSDQKGIRLRDTALRQRTLLKRCLDYLRLVERNAGNKILRLDCEKDFDREQDRDCSSVELPVSDRTAKHSDSSHHSTCSRCDSSKLANSDKSVGTTESFADEVIDNCATMVCVEPCSTSTRVCPMCEQVFPVSMSFKEFEAHVTAHFVSGDSLIGEFEDLDLSIQGGETTHLFDVRS
ncbi:unnamed protein product [Notodromas monacha]|uniref:PDZ domain-containing protein n=1 Tax=Notodromas monacha TaxID=399045 RepID=A0A7R9BKF2_9CRUS|nr:unnamed protein product [Notodromas monacha]CAG0916283.1 unnamed protein product [Notodromas monacha]